MKQSCFSQFSHSKIAYSPWLVLFENVLAFIFFFLVSFYLTLFLACFYLTLSFSQFLYGAFFSQFLFCAFSLVNFKIQIKRENYRYNAGINT